jgi:hypothetical protein
MSTGLWLVITLCLVGASAGLTLTQRILRRSRAAVVTTAAVLTGLAFVGPMLGWTVGHSQERGPATELGLLLEAGCLLAVVPAGWWAGRDPIQRLVRQQQSGMFDALSLVVAVAGSGLVASSPV